MNYGIKVEEQFTILLLTRLQLAGCYKWVTLRDRIHFSSLCWRLKGKSTWRIINVVCFSVYSEEYAICERGIRTAGIPFGPMPQI